MSFIQPYLLLGLPLFLIPILIHLLNRLRYKSVAWAAIMFIMKATKSSTSMAKIRQWLVLLLRMLALLALIFAVSRPLMSGWLGWKLSGDPDSVIVLLDRSSSMGTVFGKNYNALDKGIELISEAGLKTAQESKIIVIDSLNLKPEFVPKWSVLQHMPCASVTQASSDYALMFKKALDYILKNPGGLTEIWCVSDMKTASWHSDSPEWSEINDKLKALPVPVVIKVLALKHGGNGNRSVSFKKILHYSTEDSNSVYEAVFQLSRNSNSADVEIPVTLSINNVNLQKNIKLHGLNSIVRIRLPKPEKNKITLGGIKIPDDSNLYDNTCYFAYGEKLKGKVVVQSDDSYLNSLFTAAAFPLHDSNNVVVLNANAKLNDSILNETSLYIASGDFPNGENADALLRYLNSGGIALFFPPAVPLISTPEKKPVYSWNNAKKFTFDNPMTVTVWDGDEGIFANAASGTPLPLKSLKIFKRSTLSLGDIKSFALCADGRPFFYKKTFSGAGELFFCSTLPLDAWSNFADGTVLVPLLKRMHQKGAARFSEISFADCGKMNFNLNENDLQKVYSLENEKLNVSGNGGVGIYFYNNKFVILNRPKKLDSLTCLNDGNIHSLLKNKKVYLFSQKIENDSALQAEIWRWFLVAMFIFLIVESFMLAPKKDDLS